MTNTKTYRRTRIRKRIKKVISGTPDYPRLSVFRSNKEIYCQVIDDVNGKTLLQTSSRDKAITDLKLKSNIEVSFNVGKSVAEHALKKGIEKIVNINLSNEEKNNLEYSIKAVKELFDAAKKIDPFLV